MPSAACLNCDRTFVCDQHLKIHGDFIHCVYSDTQCKECRRVLSTRRHLQIHIDFCHSSYVNSNIEQEEISEDELIPDYDDNCSTSSEEEPPKKCKKSNRKNAKLLLINTYSKAQPKVCNKPNTGKNKAKKGPRNTSEAQPKEKPNKNDAEIVSNTSAGSPNSKNSNNSEKVVENTVGLDVPNDEDGDANFEGFQGHKRRYCKLCAYSIKGNQGKLDTHMLKEHGIPISCGMCTHVCNSRVLLKQHERTAHADVLEEEKVCSHCGKKYSSKWKLRDHIRQVHSADVVKEQVCSHCGKTFCSNWNLQDHIRHVHSKEERPKSVCPVCGVEMRAVHYKQHMRLHSGEKPYSCNVCGLKFRVSHVLKSHMATHQEAKPFQCELCGKSYRLYKVLDDHKRTSHFGEERYKCNVCGRSFKWRKSLSIHKNSHQIILPSQPEHQPRTSYSEPEPDKTTAQTNYVDQQYPSATFWGLNPGTSLELI